MALPISEADCGRSSVQMGRKGEEKCRLYLVEAGRRASPERTKSARKTHSLCEEWSRRLEDPAFTSTLPRGAKRTACKRRSARSGSTWPCIAAELSKDKPVSRLSSPGGLATSATLPRGGGGVALRDGHRIGGACGRRGRGSGSTNSKGVVAVGKALESSLSRLRSESNETAVIHDADSPDFLNPASAPHSFFNQLICRRRDYPGRRTDVDSHRTN